MDKLKPASQAGITNAKLLTGPEEKNPAERETLGENLLESDRRDREGGNGVRKAERSTSTRWFGKKSDPRSMRTEAKKRLPQAREALSRLRPKTGKAGVKTIKAAAALPFIFGMTFIFYIWQVAFGVLLTSGYGLGSAYTESWTVSILTLGLGGIAAEWIFGVGLLGTLACYMMGLFLAGGILISRQINILKHYSLVILALGLISCFIPIFCLLPWVWIWAIYVVKAQLSD